MATASSSLVVDSGAASALSALAAKEGILGIFADSSLLNRASPTQAKGPYGGSQETLFKVKSDTAIDYYLKNRSKLVFQLFIQRGTAHQTPLSLVDSIQMKCPILLSLLRPDWIEELLKHMMMLTNQLGFWLLIDYSSILARQDARDHFQLVFVCQTQSAIPCLGHFHSSLSMQRPK